MPAPVLAPSPPKVLQLLAHEHRWRLLGELSRSDRKVGELAALVGQPQNLVSYHLAQLRDGGLVTARRSSADGRDTYYRADLARCAALLAHTGAELHPGLRLAPATPPARGRRQGRGRRTTRVLFLCTGNSARSQIAQALLEQRSGGAVVARSAGSHPRPVHPNAVRVLAERGIDISERTSTSLDRFAHQRFDHVVTLCDKVREVCPELPGAAATAHWSMPDPSTEPDGRGDTYPAFVRAAEEIDARVALLLAVIDDAAGGTRATTREER